MQRRVEGAQDISRMCFVCGRENDSGLHARFLELEGGEVLGRFTPTKDHQGYPGRLHGGIASTILDETIGRAIRIDDRPAWGVTVELTIRYKKPVPLDRDVHAVGRIVSSTGRLFHGTGEIVLDDGTVAVEATGKYLHLPIERIAEGDLAEEMITDTDALPETVDV